MTHAESITIDEWSSLADLLANLIAKYAPLINLNEPYASPETSNTFLDTGGPATTASPTTLSQAA